MKKLSVLLLFFPFVLAAQNSERFISKGLLSGKGTLAFGKPTDYTATNMYVSGNLEYYAENNVSFRGGLYIFLGTSGADTKHTFSKNSACFFGYFYHLKTNNHVDPYAGLQPGISWSQLKAPDSLSNESYPYKVSSYPQAFNSLASVTVGVNYYAARYTHLFIEASYVNGMHLSDTPAISLSELKIAFGFGFNISTIKKAKVN